MSTPFPILNFQLSNFIFDVIYASADAFNIETSDPDGVTGSNGHRAPPKPMVQRKTQDGVTGCSGCRRGVATPERPGTVARGAAARYPLQQSRSVIRFRRR